MPELWARYLAATLVLQSHFRGWRQRRGLARLRQEAARMGLRVEELLRKRWHEQLRRLGPPSELELLAECERVRHRMHLEEMQALRAGVDHLHAMLHAIAARMPAAPGAPRPLLFRLSSRCFRLVFRLPPRVPSMLASALVGLGPRRVLRGPIRPLPPALLVLRALSVPFLLRCAPALLVLRAGGVVTRHRPHAAAAGVA